MSGWRGVRTQQRGAALVVCLIVLLVMSAIGIAAVSDSSLQQRMASNLRQQQLAENAAEHALRAAEQFLDQSIQSKADLGSYYGQVGGGLFMSTTEEGGSYTKSPPSIGDYLQAKHWDSGNSVEVGGLSARVTDQNPRYIIEFVGRSKEDSGKKISRLSDNVQHKFRYNFRITAIGWGLDNNSYAVLQSTYQSVRIFDY